MKQALPLNDAVEKPLPNERLDGQLYMYLMGLGLQGKRDEEKKREEKQKQHRQQHHPPYIVKASMPFPPRPKDTQGDCLHKIPFRPVPGMEFGRRAKDHPVNEANGGGNYWEKPVSALYATRQVGEELP